LTNQNHKHHYSEKLTTWKDGTVILYKECKCGVMKFFSAKPNQICKQCGNKFAVNEAIFFTKEMDFFRCKKCLSEILGNALKEIFMKEVNE